MSEQFDISSAYTDLFNRINTNYGDGSDSEVLDAAEIEKAKLAGLKLFELKPNMTEDDFWNAYMDAAPLDDDVSGMDAFKQKLTDFHVKFIQLRYGVDEPIQVDETIQDYEDRLNCLKILKSCSEHDREMFDNMLKNPNDYNVVKDTELYFSIKHVYSNLTDDNYGVLARYIYNHIAKISMDFGTALEKMTQEEADVLTNCLNNDVSDIADFEQAKKILDKYKQEMDLSELRFNVVWCEDRFKVASLPEHEKKLIEDVLDVTEKNSPELINIVDQLLNEKYKDMDFPVYRHRLEMNKKVLSED